MSDLLKLETLDVDGAIRDAAEEAGLDRSAFFRKAAVTGGGIVAAGGLFGPLLANAEAAISQKRSKRNDVRIANYALTLEFLEAEFYAQAIKNGAFPNPLYRAFAEITGDHEAQHVKALKGLLGSAAVKKPSFDFGDAVTDPQKFGATAQVLEDTGVAAYAGQGPNILQKSVVKAALSIHSVEARHAAWIRYLNTGGAGETRNLPAPKAFDTPLTEKAVLSAVKKTGFIAG
jgi:hypothetical protein